MNDQIKYLLHKELKDATITGDEVVARCPNPDHDDRKSISFSFNTKKMIGYCHGKCQRSISIHELVKWLSLDLSGYQEENYIDNDEEEILEYNKDDIIVEDLYSDLLKYQILNNNTKKVCEKHHSISYSTNYYSHTEESLEYLKSRGFKDTDKVVDKFQIGFDKNKTITEWYEENGIRKKIVKRTPSITFPCFMNDKCVYIQRRYIGDSEKTGIQRYINMKGVVRSNVVYGWDHCRYNESIVVCEGPFNALTWLYLGISAIAILGTTISDFHLDLLKDKTTILNFDYDEVGTKCYNKFINKCKNNFIDFRTEKDANEYLKQGKEKELTSLLKNKLVGLYG